MRELLGEFLHFPKYIFISMLCIAPLGAYCGTCQNVDGVLLCNERNNLYSCDPGDIVASNLGLKRCTFDSSWVDATDEAQVLDCVTSCKNLQNLRYMWIEDEMYIFRRPGGSDSDILSDFARCDKAKTDANFFKHNTNKDKSTSPLVTCSTDPVEAETPPPPQTSACDNVGTKDSAGYYICKADTDCTKAKRTLPSNATAGVCKNVGRQCNVCVARECDDGYEPYQGYCKRKAQSTTNDAISQSGNADTIVMEGYCLNAEGDAGVGDIATNTYCWCSSHMTNAPRCRLSHMFLSEQTGVCTKSNNATTRKAACDSFCQGKAQAMLQICECEEAKERGERPAGTVCYDDETPDIFTPESESDNCAKSGGVLDDNEECVCEGENLEQSEDKQTCVAAQTNEPATNTPTEGPCGGGTLNTDGTCNCDVDGANLTQSGNTCDCIDGYHRDATTSECVADESPSDVNSPTPTDPTSADSPRVTTTTPAKDPLKEAEDAYKKAKDNEQSLANRTLTAASTAATGLGLMTAASAKAEQKADTDAEQDMAAYLATFKCEYGRGQSVPSSAEEITLPGGNELVEYYQEYKSLADNLKTTKKALGLRAGIESEVIYDKAESNLYKYSSVGKTDGAFTSLSRALNDPEGEDAAAWNTQKEESAKKLKTGAVAAGGGVVGGIGGNAVMNTDMIKNIANKFKGSDTESK